MSKIVGNESGFTIVQVIVSVVLAVVVIGGVYQIMIVQNRLYSKQRELMDVRGTLRAAAGVLAGELRMLSASGGDLLSLDPDSVTIRSVSGSGILCGTDTLDMQYGLTATSGEFFATSDDSVLVYDAGAGSDPWVVTAVDEVMAGGGDVPTCDWGAATEAVLRVDTLDGSALSGVAMGAPVIAFRRVTYGLYQAGDRWWLGRRVGTSGAYEALAGPMRSPTDSGLALSFFDSAGAATTTPANVRQIEFLLRGESLKGTRVVGGAPAAQRDTLKTKVFLRG